MGVIFIAFLSGKFCAETCLLPLFQRCFAPPRYAVRLLRESGSFDHTRAELTRLDARLREEVDRLGGNRGLVGLLDELKNW